MMLAVVVFRLGLLVMIVISFKCLLVVLYHFP